MITNRPIHCYGVLVGSAQRSLWSSEFTDRPPINFMHVYNNHYVALLPISENAINNETYTYFCRFISDEEKIAFQQREPHHIPVNEIRFSEDQNEVIID
jgi:hypothetical protein